MNINLISFKKLIVAFGLMSLLLVCGSITGCGKNAADEGMDTHAPPPSDNAKLAGTVDKVKVPDAPAVGNSATQSFQKKPGG